VPVIHRENFVCLKADGYIHPDHETSASVVRRHCYAISSLLAVRAKMAAYCPSVAASYRPPLHSASAPREHLAIREGEFTVEHRPMSLRILLVECFVCPDPEPLEPIVNPDPAAAEVIAAAAASALGELRYLAEIDGYNAAVLARHDTAVADALGIDAAAVPALTGTTRHLTKEHAEFERLLDTSSLGPARGTLTEQQRGQRGAARISLNRIMREMDAAQDDDAAGLAQALDVIRAMPMGIRTAVRPLLLDLVKLLDAEGIGGPPRGADKPDTHGQAG
jgi:hypothetical protein